MTTKVHESEDLRIGEIVPLKEAERQGPTSVCNGCGFLTEVHYAALYYSPDNYMDPREARLFCMTCREDLPDPSPEYF